MIISTIDRSFNTTRWTDILLSQTQNKKKNKKQKKQVNQYDGYICGQRHWTMNNERPNDNINHWP